MLPRLLRRSLRVFCALAALVFCFANSYAASGWQVIKVGPRDYLSIENIARFYGLPTGVKPAGREGKTINLDNGRLQLQVTLDSREVIINGVRNTLSFPIAEKDGQYLMSRIDLAKTVEPQFRPQMIPNLGKVTTVVLDPGHGGFDKGACSSYGCEKDYVLDIAKQLKPMLEARGFKVVMTRESDVFIPLEQRARIANATRDSVFVSLHLNATDWNPAAAGFEIYSLTPRGAPSTQDNALALRFFQMQLGSPADAQSVALSMSIYHSVLGHLQEFDRGIKRARFAVLRLTKIPAVLIEGGFLTDRAESKLIANPQWRTQYAQSIAMGLENYELLAEKHQCPMMLADYQRQLGGELVARDATQPPPDNPAVIPASNTQHLTNASALVSPPSAIESAKSEQEQEEPERGAAPTESAPQPLTDTPPPLVEEPAVPGSSPEASPVESATPEQAASPAVQESVAPQASPPPAPSPAQSPAQPQRMPSLAERILRWVTPMPHFFP